MVLFKPSCPVVLDGVTMNLEPNPKSCLQFGGANLSGVKSWKAILEGLGRAVMLEFGGFSLISCNAL